MAAKKKPGGHKQNKPHGHFCFVCGEHKANEKFTGSGHAHHICKKCQKLPVAQRNEMLDIRKISSMVYRYISKADIKWLRGKMDDSRPAVRDAAREAYSMKFPNQDRALAKISELKTPVLFSELNEKQKAETLRQLGELIDHFLSSAEYIPDNEDRGKILEDLCEEVTEFMNLWEPEPYDPVAEYYEQQFDFDPEIGFSERIKEIDETLDEDEEGYDPYEEPEEPEQPPPMELIADDALRAAFWD